MHLPHPCVHHHLAHVSASCALHWDFHTQQEEAPADGNSVDPTKFVAKKSKAAAKKGVGNTQVRFEGRAVPDAACVAPAVP